MLQQIELASTFSNNFFQLATTLFNLERNNVALQVQKKCSPYYQALSNEYGNEFVIDNIITYWLLLANQKTR